MTDRQRQALEVFEQCNSNVKEAAKQLGVSLTAAYTLLKRARTNAADTTTPDTAPKRKPSSKTPPPGKDTWEQKGDKATSSFITDQPCKTVEDVLQKGNIDGSIWEVDRFKLNSWEGFYTHGEKVDRDHRKVPLWQVTVWLERKKVNTEEFIQGVIDKMISHSPKAEPINYGVKETGYMLELDVMDLHIGKLAWRPETNNNWDIKIATTTCNAAVDELLTRVNSYTFDKILIPVGNDLLHVDNLLNETAAGTRQDCEGRTSKMFMAALEMLVQQIDRLKQIAPVFVPVIPGNHDLMSTYHLGVALHCWYHADPNVEIDISPIQRKYVHYGNVLLGYCHGGKEDPRMRDLPLTMATEQPEAWAITKHRRWHLGHLHKSRKLANMHAADTFQGIVVQIIRSLTATDYWHHKKGFIQPNRAAEAFVYHFDDGLVQNNLAYAPEL